MRRTELLQEIRKMRFEEAYEGWNAGRLTQVYRLGLSGHGFATQAAFRMA